MLNIKNITLLASLLVGVACSGEKDQTDDTNTTDNLEPQVLPT